MSGGLNEGSLAAPPALAMRGVAKRFGPTVALDGVDLEVAAGEVHAVIGENGAGKSTLMNSLYGIVRPDAGGIEINGAPYRPESPAHALRSGLAMIHQELTLAPALSVEANILLGLAETRGGFLMGRRNRARARAALGELRRGDIDPDALVGSLSVGERQIVEIARALAANARIIVMDEPTSSLTARDREGLFEVIRRLRERGLSVIYISHFLEEIEAVCDRYTVLRDGRTAGSGVVAGTPRARLIELMVGRKIEEFFPGGGREPGEAVMRVEGLSGARSPRGVSFDLRRGEIFGLAGLIGSGRTETLRAIFGLEPIAGGRVLVSGPGGAEGTMSSELPTGPAGRIRRGLGLLSEDRKSEGLALTLSVAENMVMSRPDSISRLGWIRRGRLVEDSNNWIRALSIRSATPDAPVRTLSGGNQQKVAIARLLQQRADVLLLDEPTRGVDIGSKAEIYQLMDKLAREGRAIVFVSSYLPELLGVCDRIGVLSRGELVEIRPARDWTEHEIMTAATGSSRES